MDVLIVFLIFTAVMAACLILNITMILPLTLGFILFSGAALRRGFSAKEILSYAAESLKDSFIVIGILLLIGCLTGMWRLSGTVAYFVTVGVSVIPPGLFLLAAFLLASAMSYALGTSFGVTATAGVILMSIAKAGGVDPIPAAGAILSGVYVGDRGSPAASSGNLVAVLTHTDMRRNVREMLKCSAVPFLVCCAVYGLLSASSPMQSVQNGILDLLGSEFELHWLCILPAVLMIVLPFCGLSIKLSMAASLLASAAAAIFLQHATAGECLRAMLLGYEAKNAELETILSGGGVASMTEVCVILMISCSYGSIFEHTGLLDGINRRVETLSARLGRFPVMLLLGLGVSSVFCNQTIGAIMQSNLSQRLYGGSDGEKNAKMLAMENSVILVSGLVPWCIACSVPRAMLSAEASCVPYAFYLWLVPLWWLIRSEKGERKA